MNSAGPGSANPQRSSLRVLIADDHRIVREGLKQVLGDAANGAPEIVVCAEAQTGPEALQQVQALGGDAGIDVVLLDIALPQRDGLDVLQALRAAWPRLPVLMLSTYPERQYAVRCIKLGSAGYLNKSAESEVLVAAVRKAAAGGIYVSAATAEALALAASKASTTQSLSHREHQVFRLLISGHGVSEIGARLGLAPNTVSTYRARILEKTGARNDVELALYAQAAGQTLP